MQEALASYFEAEEERKEKVRRALSAIGSLDDEQAGALKNSVRKLRRRWR